MKNIDKFIDDLNKHRIFEDIINIISNDKEFLENIFVGKDKKRLREQIIRRINNNNFNSLYKDCSKEGKRRLSNIISHYMNFSDYFDETDNYLYDHFRINELLKDKSINNIDEILDYAYKSQKGNSLLIITFFAQKIVEEEGFMERLESNYGIYLGVDNFIQDMNEKLNEIKSFVDLYKYVESDFGKNKTNLELIIEAYERAQKKGYIKAKYSPKKNRNRSNSRGRDLSQSKSSSRRIRHKDEDRDKDTHRHRNRSGSRERSRSRSRNDRDRHH